MIMGLEEYEGLVRYLNSPGKTIIRDVKEHLHPHNPSEDSNWPTPKTTDEAYDLQSKLPLKQQIYCNLLALNSVKDYCLEIVSGLDEFKDSVEDCVTLIPETIESCFKVIKGIDEEQVLDKYIERLNECIDYFEQVAYIANIFGGMSNKEHFAGRFYAALTAFTQIVRNNYDDYRGYGDIRSTVEMVIDMQGSPYHGALNFFFSDWWNRCKCTLAFADVTTAELE